MSCSNEARRVEDEDKIPVVPVTALQARDVSIPQHYICDIHAVQNVEIRARVQGYLEAIYVDEGQAVKKGQALFRISAHEYKEMVSKAEANLKRAIAEAKTTSLELDRVKLMVDKEIISATELEVAKARKEAGESAIQEAKSVLQNAQINLSYTYIKAPFDGIVDRIPFKIGSLINSGTLLTSVSNVEEVFAYFRVSETEYLRFIRNQHKEGEGSVRQRQVSLILADGTLYPHKGFVETMEGDFEKATGSIAFRARFPNPELILKHGASGKIQMLKPFEDAVLVPQHATFTIQDKNYVFILDKENKARARSFDPIERYERFFVAKGLEKGEKIILEGLQHIREGYSIEPEMISPDSVLISAI